MPYGSHGLRVVLLDKPFGFVPDVQGGVHVPVVQDPALRARPFPDIQVLGLRVPVSRSRGTVGSTGTILSTRTNSLPWRASLYSSIVQNMP